MIAARRASLSLASGVSVNCKYMSDELRKISRLALCLTFLLSASKCVQAQLAWHQFSPPDESFTVELPAKPLHAIGRADSSGSIFENIKSAYIYTLSLNANDSATGCSFGVLHLSRLLSDREFDESVNSNMLWIGGDDKHFSKEADVIVSGFHGREFIYDKGIASGRALVINARNRVYLLLFHTEIEGEVSSERVARIFRTFKPKRRVRNVTKRLTTHSK